LELFHVILLSLGNAIADRSLVARAADASLQWPTASAAPAATSAASASSVAFSPLRSRRARSESIDAFWCTPSMIDGGRRCRFGAIPSVRYG
jgi:hypothetical protein